MAFFIATGIISNDIVRKETRKGVLTTFRLETGVPRGRKLWIDIECWGHLAGTMAHHGVTGREVNVSGRLTQKTWRDKASGESRHRIVVTAKDVDLSSQAGKQLYVPNSVVLRGTVQTVLPSRITQSGIVSCIRIAEGRAGRKTGHLELGIEYWSADGAHTTQFEMGRQVTALGSLTVGVRNTTACGGAILDARSLVIA